MKEISKIATALFDKIRTRFDSVSIGDESAKSTSDPSKARFFNFEYTNSSGKKFGNVTISIIDHDSLKVYFGKNISADLDQEEQDEWFQFLRELRFFAKRHLMSFDTRDISRSNLDLRDIKQQAKSDGTFTVKDVVESKMYGHNGRQSYSDIGNVRLAIRHSDRIDPEKRGDRSRKIESVFIETADGERFKVPFTNLRGARAMARHVSEGGSCHDERGIAIAEMVAEMAAMRHFIRGMKNRQFEDVETQHMSDVAVRNWDRIRSVLHAIGSSQRGYNKWVQDTIDPDVLEIDVDLPELRERFVKKVYDERFDSALPYVYRAYQRDKQVPDVEDFEKWADSVTNNDHGGDMLVEDDGLDVVEFNEIISKPLEAGVDGTDAIMALNGFIESDELDDLIYDASRQPGGESLPVNDIVRDWMMTQPEYSNIMDDLEWWSNTTAEEEKTDQTSVDTESQAQPATEDIGRLRKLAGI